MVKRGSFKISFRKETMPSDEEDLIYDDDDDWKFEDEEEEDTVIVSSHKSVLMCFYGKFKWIMVPLNGRTIGFTTPLAWIH